MRIQTKTMVIALAVATGLLVTGAAAQHEEHQHDQAAPQADSASGMPKMHAMMMDQKDAARLVDQLVASFATIQAETDAETLKQELTEHGKLLKELQTKMQDQAHKMGMMHSMMGMESKNR